MAAQILVVDDVPANIKLLEAKLATESYEVITAKDGAEAIEQIKKRKPDLILLDVMMPGMDGFEVCRKIKEDREVSHIPVVMVTALSEKADRLKGLEIGADDFLTKPINDMALFSRVRSLVRIKTLLDELRLRDKTNIEMGIEALAGNNLIPDIRGARVLLVDDDNVQGRQVVAKLNELCKVEWIQDAKQALAKATAGNFDVILISTLLSDMDGLQLASQIRSQEEMHSVPIIVFVDEDDQRMMLKALEMNVNDYLTMPVEKNEMTARVRAQIRRKKYQELLQSYSQNKISAAADGMIGLYNRQYFNAYLSNVVQQALKNSKQLGVMIVDMDNFTHVGNTHGREAGNLALRQLADVMVRSMRSTDLTARFGAEEFVLLMPETDSQAVIEAASRLRAIAQATPFRINSKGETITCTISIGVANLIAGNDSAEALLKRAEDALYDAKHSGQNMLKVEPKSAPKGW